MITCVDCNRRFYLKTDIASPIRCVVCHKAFMTSSADLPSSVELKLLWREGVTLKDLKKEIIYTMYKLVDQNKLRTAKRLGLSHRCVRYVINGR